jgi:hypothetical protein
MNQTTAASDQHHWAVATLQCGHAYDGDLRLSEHMKQREWSVPDSEAPQGQAGESPDAKQTSRGALETSRSLSN